MSVLAALAAPSGERVLAEALASWLPRQRWYAGKARDLESVHVRDLALVEHVLFVLAEAHFADGGSEPYHVPLAIGADPQDGAAVVARLPEAALVDAAADPEAVRVLTRLALHGGEHDSVRGARVTGQPVPSAATAVAEETGGPVRVLGGEQSNTSAVLGDRLLVKLFRRPEAGENPDVELTRALTERAVDAVPAQYGALVLAGGQMRTLAVVTEFLPGAHDGWSLAVDELDRLSAGKGTPPGGLLEACEPLGAAVAVVHAGLADAFGRSPAGPEHLERWQAGMLAQAQRVLELAERRAGPEAAPVLDRRERILAACERPSSIGDAGPLVRVHGDLHLGQVLRDGEGRWRVVDFEGEPARPLTERREPHTPLKDVAGMLRSFDYAAAQVAGGGQVENWRAAARRRFLAGYRELAAPAGLLPADQAALELLLALMELDKAVYELGYELANRPDWVVVPVAGILTALDRIDQGADR